MRTAVIDDTKVVNVIEADPEFTLPGFLLVPTDTAGPGWTYDPDSGEFSPPPPQPEPVPQSVTMRQARLALLQAGLLAQVDTAIDALPEPDKSAARIEWEYSQEVHRDRPFVAMLAPALGLDDEALDALFIHAATL